MGANAKAVGPALAALVGLYFALGSVYLFAAPAFEKPDEEWHYAYVVYLLERGRLPPLSVDATANPARQEAGQPPLYYGLAALTLRLLGQDALVPDLRPNPFWAYPAPGTVNDNKNRFVHPADERLQPEYRPTLILRGLSLGLGAGAVISAYGLARALGRGRRAGLAGAAFVAALPQYLFIAGSVSNDALVATLSGAAVWALVVALHRPAAARLWLVFGLIAGLAAATKTSALLLPLVGAACASLVGVRRRSARPALVGGLASLGGVAVLAGWWYVRNLNLYADPFGLSVHVAEMGRAQPLTAGDLSAQIKAIETSFWAAFGWGNVLLPAWIYWGIRLAELLALAGLGRALWRARRIGGAMGDLHWAVLLYLFAIAAGLAWWTRTVSGSLGRLLYPALAPLAAIIILGWERFWPRLPGLALGWLAAAALVSPVFIARAYRPPRMLPEGAAPAEAQRAQIDFGDLARLFAFDVSPRRLAPGDATQVTLCWQALGRTAIDYTVFVHLLGEANTILGRRETYPGLGAYATSLWRPGDRFCDTYSTPVSLTAPGPAVYAVEIGLFDLRTGERLPPAAAAGQRLGLVTLDHVKVAGPSPVMPASVARAGIIFGDEFTLLGYRVGPARAGLPLEVDLYWQANNAVGEDYTVFVHLLNMDGEIAAQGDSPPQAGRYPTRWWDAGETVLDAHAVPLPADLPEGEYRLLVGWYLPQTGERLPASGGGGDSADLGVIRIER